MSDTNEARELTKTEQAIIELLKENTGQHICDSGGAYGRNYERNKDKDYSTVPSCSAEVYSADNIEISYEIFHYLNTFLELDEKMTNEMLELARDKWPEACWFEVAQNYSDYLANNYEEFESYGINNTYNYDNTLSQVLQYHTISLVGSEYDVYLILQVHGGCDVRGGYSSPKVFKVEERDYFLMAQQDVNCWCDKCQAGWHSDNCGYSWYPNNEEPEFKDSVEYKEGPDNDVAGELRHKDCGGKIEFGVMDCY